MQTRVRLLGAGAAAPDAAIALTCLAAFLLPDFRESIAGRTRIALVTELLAIHGFIFLASLALIKVTRWWSHVLRVAAFLILCALYSRIAFDWGWDAVVAFWMLTFATYFGFFLRDSAVEMQRVAMLIYRWLIATVAYFGLLLVSFSAGAVLGLENVRSELLFGFLFFSTLAACDVLSVYERLADSIPRRLLRLRGSHRPD